LNWKRTITAGLSALAISGVLFGAGLTSTAHAATATTPTAAGEVAAQASRNFGVLNGLEGVTLELAGVYGKTEGHPPIGSTFGPRQGYQHFEVQTAFLQDRDVFVTYKVHKDGEGYLGDIQLQLTVDTGEEVSSRLSVNNTPYSMHLAGSATSFVIAFG